VYVRVHVAVGSIQRCACTPGEGDLCGTRRVAFCSAYSHTCPLPYMYCLLVTAKTPKTHRCHSALSTQHSACHIFSSSVLSEAAAWRKPPEDSSQTALRLDAVTSTEARAKPSRCEVGAADDGSIKGKLTETKYQTQQTHLLTHTHTHTHNRARDYHSYLHRLSRRSTTNERTQGRQARPKLRIGSSGFIQSTHGCRVHVSGLVNL
jgi:hypothetical protein